METQYHQFGSSDSSTVHGEPRTTVQTGKTCTSFHFDSIISDVTLNYENMSVSVCRYEEHSGLCPLRSPGAAAVNPADGHWDQMCELYELSSEADSLITFFR